MYLNTYHYCQPLNSMYKLNLILMGSSCHNTFEFYLRTLIPGSCPSDIVIVSYNVLLLLQSTVSSTIAEGQHKSQNTPLQITNSSEQVLCHTWPKPMVIQFSVSTTPLSSQSAPSTSREMVEGKHVTFRVRL